MPYNFARAFERACGVCRRAAEPRADGDIFIDLNIGALRAKRLHERLCRAHGVVAFGRDALAAHAAHIYVDERVFARFGADGIVDVDGGDHAVEQVIAAGAARDVERQIHFCITFDRRRKHILPSLPLWLLSLSNALCLCP